MTEDQLVHEAERLTPFERHKFLVLVGGTIVVSLILVAIALMLYVKNGTEQLDLSRPGYQAVGRTVTENTKAFDGFESSGPLDKSVADKFMKLYQSESDNVTKADAFSGHPLSKHSLSISGK